MKNELVVALAGNANVGKSVIFNQLTGLNQITGNWPGKTVERAEGTLHFEGQNIRVIDLPGVYSFSAFSMEEIVSRDYLAIEKPDVIINVVDASALERNLYLTLQLIELKGQVVVALNQIDLATKKGLRINLERLSEKIGLPVVSTVAVTGTGITELLLEVLKKTTTEKKSPPTKIEYGKEIEKRIRRIETLVNSRLPKLCQIYPARWIAIKLLEKDKNIIEKAKTHPGGKGVLEQVNTLTSKLEKIHGESSSVIMASERYSVASRITEETVHVETPPRVSWEQKLASVTTHRVYGYLILASVFSAVFIIILLGGSFLSGMLESLFAGIYSYLENFLANFLPEFAVDVLTRGVFGGIVAGITIALPYIVPFYLILALLEDSGYLPRAAFLMDNLMHKIGLHGKAFIPLILGYGCSVPACASCRIMETERERFLAALVVVLIPCAARTVVILGLVGRYVGLLAALSLYIFDLLIVFAIGRVAFKTLPGEPVGLIMEMPSYKKPSLRNIAIKTWSRTKDFVYVAFPIIILGSLIVEVLYSSGMLTYFVELSSPLITGWLGLPAVVAIPLIFGVLRKELSLVLLSEALAIVGLTLQSLTEVQMIVFSLVVMLYIPCIATIAICRREFGWNKTLAIAAVSTGLAFFLGGVAFRFLSLFPFS